MAQRTYCGHKESRSKASAPPEDAATKPREVCCDDRCCAWCPACMVGEWRPVPGAISDGCSTAIAAVGHVVPCAHPSADAPFAEATDGLSPPSANFSISTETPGVETTNGGAETAETSSGAKSRHRHRGTFGRHAVTCDPSTDSVLRSVHFRYGDSCFFYCNCIFMLCVCRLLTL